MPVDSTTCCPRHAASAAATWWAHGSTTPLVSYAARTCSGTQAGHGAPTAARGASSSTWVSRSARPGTAANRSNRPVTGRTAPEVVVLEAVMTRILANPTDTT